jgi:polysaccharide export outer membrane protein
VKWLLLFMMLGQEPQGYVLGVDDQITVQVLDLDEVNAKGPIRVDMRGNITLPLVGRLHVAGMSVEQVEAAIKERLKSVLKEPEVSVAVADFRSHPVSVLGAVKSPGVQQIRGVKTLSEVLSMAGGISGDAGNTIKVSRRKDAGALPLPVVKDDESGQYTVGEANIKNLMEAKNPADNIAILPNDVITVPKGELVYIIGAVKKSGGFVLNEKESITILQAIAMADGFDRFAAKNKALILRPVKGTQDKQEIPVDLRPLLAGKMKDFALLPNDILFVPVSGSKQAFARATEAAIGLGTGLVLYRR